MHLFLPAGVNLYIFMQHVLTPFIRILVFGLLVVKIQPANPQQYAHFLHLQMRRPAAESYRDEPAFRYLVLRSVRIILWWCIAEYMIHAMYMHSIQSNETYLEILPPWALGKSLYNLYFQLLCTVKHYVSALMFPCHPLQTHTEHVVAMQNLKICYPHRI